MKDRSVRQFDTMTELVDCIEKEHHGFLRDELEPLGELVDFAVEAHEDELGELLELQEAFDALRREIPAHLAQEEQILFPAVRKLEQKDASEIEKQTARQLLDGLVDEHEKTLTHLETIRSVIDDFSLSADAPDNLQELYRRLERLDEDLRLHIHRENEVLFPAFKEATG